MTDIEVGYLTDVEGNLNYFDRWLPTSGVLQYRPGTTETLELTHDRAYFVYGGDLIDRFDGSLRLARRIVDLKKRAPDRVFLLAGNRDLNKVRLTSELADSDMSRPYTDIPGPHWDPRAPTLAQYLDELAAAKGVPAQSLDTKAARLNYYLVHTLGCPNGFELRRKELFLLKKAQGVRGALITDDDVVASMVADIAPGGVLREYLELASIAVVLGNTLFVHGSLDPMSINKVPEDATRFCTPPNPQPFRELSGGVAEWAKEMNALMQRGLADHAARPEWDSSRRERGGEVLLALQNRASLSGRCVVSGAYADGGTITSADAAARRAQINERAASTPNHEALLYESWTSDPRDETVAKWLLEGGVRRVVVGHKPSGDSPAVLAAKYTGVEIISADTCYADGGSADGRGNAVAGVSLHGPSLDVNCARIFGTLADGRAHEARLATLSSSAAGPAGAAAPPPPEGGDLLVGSELDEGWWVKALVKADAGAPRVYHCCRGSGRTVEYRDEVHTD